MSNKISETFSEIYKIVQEYKEYMVNIRLDNKITKKLIDKLEIKVNLLSRQFEKFDIDIKSFINEKQGYLFHIHEILVGTFSKTYVKDFESDIIKIRSVHDKLFKKCLNISQPRHRFGRLPTWLFSNFCKGITYFKNNIGIDEIPVYHREQSCGSKEMTASEKFVESDNKNKQIYLRNCYIERFIYDQIYINTFHNQNIEHLIELRQIERLYQNAFPYENLVIKVSYRDDIHPCCLVLTYTTKDGLLIRETYTKSINNQINHCKKFSSDGNEYEKIQTYDQEVGWIKS
jgi:hypothetical protein